MQISSLSLYDYTTLVGHYARLQHGPSIDPRLLDRFKDNPERLKQIREQAKKGGNNHQALNVKFKAPLENFDFPNFGYVFTLYKKYAESGILPFPGALADQPSQIIEVFNTLESLELEVKQREYDKQQRDMKRKSRGKR